MLSLLLYLACAVFDPHQVELDRIVQMHKRMGHPAMSAYGIELNEHGKLSNRAYVLIWHKPNKTIVSGDIVTRSGLRVFIISLPRGVEPSIEAKRGVKELP